MGIGKTLELDCKTLYFSTDFVIYDVPYKLWKEIKSKRYYSELLIKFIGQKFSDFAL